MKKNMKYKTFNIICLLMIVSVLVVVASHTSYSLLSNSLVEKLGVNEENSKNISLNYAKNGNYTFEIVNPKKISDFRGKYLYGNGYFDFEVELPNNYEGSDISYDVILTSMNNNINIGSIKVYLTTQNNFSVEGFNENVPVLSAFEDKNNGKVIYTGNLNDKNRNDKLRLRVWVRKDYFKDINDILVFKLQVNVG